MSVFTDFKVKVYTPTLSSINVTIPVQKTEINAGGLQVIYSNTRYVIIPRISNGAMLRVGGDITATGNITAYFSSDERLKENIKPIENALDKIEKINGVEFDWKDSYIQDMGGEDDYFVRKHDVGVIAQELQEVLPEVVAERKETGMLAVKYDRIVPLLIQSIKELKKEIEQLKQNK
jgi:hypothetical protein